ncbi:MAG TPA: DUF1949 domain-containing protein, partial [Mobilitalea sp.]|nr:DUF1949 domain-containing protein [Mobilitalea sp.]
EIITKSLGVQLSVTTDYNYIGKIQYYIAQDAIPVLSSDYSDLVRLNILVLPSQKQNFIKKITELTSGSAIFEELKQIYFTSLNNEIHLF